jgi:TfoX/Sxy family transcriptional regulator of competence genes
MNEFNEYVRETFSAVGDVVIRAMMGGYFVYFSSYIVASICLKLSKSIKSTCFL